MEIFLAVIVSATGRAAMRSACGAASSRSSTRCAAVGSAARGCAVISAATRRAGHCPAGVGASAWRATTVSSVTAATGRTGHWPTGIGASARWATSVSSGAAARHAGHWLAGIGASVARRHDWLMHIERWPARSAVVEAAVRIVFKLPRRRRRLRIVRSRLRSALPFKCPAAV